jgi:hypothetical protein
MGLYNKINDSQVGVARKLFDYSVQVNGRLVETTRIGVNSDIWGNEENKALSNETLTAIVKLPNDELPLIRFRADGRMSETPGNSSLFFYDVLPIEVYFQFKDRVEDGDVFYFTVKGETGKPIPIILRIKNSVGAFTTELIWRKFYAAPITSLTELDESVVGRVMEKIAS